MRRAHTPRDLEQEPQTDHAMSREHASPDSGGAARRLALAATGVVALVCVILTAFAWPMTQAQPREVPVAVAAPQAVEDQLGQRLGAVSTGAGETAAWDLEPVDDREAAVDLIAEREVSGAIVIESPGQPGEMLVASAGGAATAQVLGQLAASMPAELGGPFSVTDVVPLPADDPRGAGISAAALPLIVGGLLIAVLLVRMASGPLARIGGALAIAAATGLAAAGILQSWLGAIEANYWANSGVLALGLAAIALSLLGLHHLWGLKGMIVGEAGMILLGNPLSGASVNAELLPAGWAELGQALPPGSTLTALRSASWFDGAGSGAALIVLAAWVLAGLLLLALPRRRHS